MRKLILGGTASARVVLNVPAEILPGKNVVTFANPDKRQLTGKVTVRDLATGKSVDFTAAGSSDKLQVPYTLGESKYELLFTAYENQRMIFFDAKVTDTSAFRKEFAVACNAVKRWKDIPAYAALKKELLAEGAKLMNGNDFDAMNKFIAKVEKTNLDLQLNELYSATLKNFTKSVWWSILTSWMPPKRIC